MDSLESPLSPSLFHVLLTLHRRALHGYGIKKEVQLRTAGRIDLDAGGLYRLIARLEAHGLVRHAAAPRRTGDDRKRFYYTLTPAGERLLTAEARSLASLVASPDVAALIQGAST